MKAFSIDETNNIKAFGAKQEAVSVSGLPFSSQKELAKLTAEWPVSRFIEIWNGFAGVAPFGDLKPVKKFTDRKVAVARMWQAIQRLGADSAASNGVEPEAAAEVAVAPELVDNVPAAATTEIEPADSDAAVPEPTLAETPAVQPAPQAEGLMPSPEQPADVRAQVADVGPGVESPSVQTTPAKKARKASQKSKAEKQDSTMRESKAAQVIAMLQRPDGATITEVMEKMGWQKHTVRGFMAGALKKAGYNVESFKPEGGERSYRINK
jgi:hypothetical protein